MQSLTEEEVLEFERLCDIQGISADERAQIVCDVFGKAEARLYEEARDEILALFPELREDRAERAGARLLASGRMGRMGRKLATRHVRNGKPLVH